MVQQLNTLPEGWLDAVWERLVQINDDSSRDDVTEVKPTTIRTTQVILGLSQTFIVQTIRQRDVGDHIFLETVSRDGSTRIALPPQVADAIARQRDALTAWTSKARGEQPAFLKRA